MASIGEFIHGGEGFRITEPVTPTPMLNVLCNMDGFACEVSQSGMPSGSLKYADGETAALIRENNCALYLRDDSTGDIWCIGGYPYVSSVENYCCEHYAAYTRISSSHGGIDATLRLFVPDHFKGIVFTLTLANQSGRPRCLSIIPAAVMALNGFSAPRFCDSQNQVSWGDFSASANGYFFHSRNPWQKKHDCYCAILCTGEPVDSWEGEQSAFCGSNMSLSDPWALRTQEHLTSKRSLGGAPFASIMVRKELPVGRSTVIDYALSLVRDEAAAVQVYETIRCHEQVDALWCQTVAAVDLRYSGVRIETPDGKLTRFVNLWLKKGMEYCLIKKSATRDNLQFSHGLAMTNPPHVKHQLRHILRCQYQDGHTLRSWKPLDTTYYSDGPLWIVMTVCGYLKYSSDMAFLEESIPYYDGGSSSVHEHLTRGLRRILADRGPHGLPLARYADWNDALNLTDPQAESVFMAMALGYMLLEMAELEAYLNHAAKAEAYRALHAQLKALINSVAWDEDAGYYIRGFSHGKRIGAPESSGSIIYANPQSWSILGGIVTEERLPRIQAALDRFIESDLGCVVNYPAYEHYDPEISRISVQVPGTVENGAVYCHATGFKVYADTLLGQGDRALNGILKILPDSEKNPASRSGALPFAMTSSFNIDPGTWGRAGRPWLTGTQCWVMNTIVEGILGVRRAYGGLMMKPALPSAWNEADCTLNRPNSRYSIHIRRTGACSVTLDGVPLPDAFVPFVSGEHTVLVTV